MVVVAAVACILMVDTLVVVGCNRTVDTLVDVVVACSRTVDRLSVVAVVVGRDIQIVVVGR